MKTTVKVIGKIDLPLSNSDMYKEEKSNEIVRIQNQLENSDSEEEYYAYLEERQMYHWLQLGINTEATDKYFNKTRKQEP